MLVYITKAAIRLKKRILTADVKRKPKHGLQNALESDIPMSEIGHRSPCLWDSVGVGIQWICFRIRRLTLEFRGIT
jgi:hypothetical protein